MRQYSTIGAAVKPIVARLLLSAAALSGVAGVACSKADTTPPVATVSFASNKSRVPLGSPVELTYRFDVAPNAALTGGEYRVFVHVFGSDGQELWKDDHDPEPATSTWKPGQKVQYTRTRFVPITNFQGEARVEIGLYRNEERLPLQGPDAADKDSASRSYHVGSLQLAPQSENLFVIYKAGWHPAEYAPDDPTKDWQWTQKSSVLALRNPHKDITFYLEFDARTDPFVGAPQQVTVFAGDQALATFPADSTLPTLRKVPVTAAQLGSNEMAELRIEVDRTFVPAKLSGGGRDGRELGIRVYHAFVETR
jgi:hypothetical protein